MIICIVKNEQGIRHILELISDFKKGQISAKNFPYPLLLDALEVKFYLREYGENPLVFDSDDDVTNKYMGPGQVYKLKENTNEENKSA
jgi:hypothetical protein